MDGGIWYSKGLLDDIIIEIQLRLPVKSIVRFRCVCKRWNKRFRNHDFVYSHYSRQKALTSDPKLLMKLSKNPPKTGVHVLKFVEAPFYFKAIEPPPQVKVVCPVENIFLPVVKGMMGPQVVGHHNGIVCLSYSRRVFKDHDLLALWNPATREFRFLPPSQTRGPLTYRSGTGVGCFVGFGYDPKTLDYRVVKFVSKSPTLRCGAKICSGVCRAELYSLNANSWERIPDFEYEYDRNLENSTCLLAPEFDNYLNGGICYWIFDKDLLYFDMVDQVFKRMNRATFGLRSSFSTWRLASYDGCLAAIVSQVKGAEILFYLWVRKQLNGEQSWVKQFSVGPFPRGSKPLGFWKKETFLVAIDDQPASYDLNTQRLTILPLGPDAYVLEVISYVESLVPINGRGEHEEGALRTTSS